MLNKNVNKQPTGKTYTIKDIHFRNSDRIINEAILTKTDFMMLTNGNTPYFFTKFYIPTQQNNVYINPRVIASFELK